MSPARSLQILLPMLCLMLPAQGQGQVADLPLPEPLQSIAPQTPAPASFFGRHGALTPREMEMARAAWSYFEARFQPETGLVNTVGAYPSTTL